MGKKVGNKLVYCSKKSALIALVLLICCMFQACSKKLSDAGDGASSNLLITNRPTKALSNEPPSNTTSITKVPDTALTLTPQKETTYINWIDKELEALIREVIHKPEGEILVEEVESIKDLCIISGSLMKEKFSKEEWSSSYFDEQENTKQYNIKDWSELSYLKSLEHLVLYDNDIKNIEFIKNLTNITFLNLLRNDIEDYKPLSSLTSLHQLYLGDDIVAGELEFLRDLPIEDSDLFCTRYYKLQFSKEDSMEGITAGNLVNTGFVSFDGSNLYTMETSWGDLAHGNLVQYQVEAGKINFIDSMITEQMAKLWNCEPGGYINQNVNSLNYYKDHIYYISRGTNNNTAGPVGDYGEYYLGDETFGIIKCNVTTEERKLLTTERFRYLCVARDHIYGVNENNEFVQMTLVGKDRALVVKEPCTFAYVNDEMIYYLTAGKKTKLILMKEDSGESQMILEGDISKPVIKDNFVYYMDASSYLCRYDMTTKETTKISEDPIESYNLDANNIYVISETKGVCRMNLDGSNMTIVFDHLYGYESIQIVGDYLFINPYPDLWKIKKDGTDLNMFHEYY